MTQASLVVLQLVIGVIFLRAVVGKLNSPGSISLSIEAFGLVPDRSAPVFAAFLVISELVIATSHISGQLMWPASIAAAVLLVVMLCAVIIIIARGTEVTCDCFGEGSEETVSGKTIVRLVLLLGSEGILIAGQSMEVYDGSVANLSAIDFLLAFSAAVLISMISSWLLRLSNFRSLWADCATCRKGH